MSHYQSDSILNIFFGTKNYLKVDFIQIKIESNRRTEPLHIGIEIIFLLCSVLLNDLIITLTSLLLFIFTFCIFIAGYFHIYSPKFKSKMNEIAQMG